MAVNISAAQDGVTGETEPIFRAVPALPAGFVNTENTYNLTYISILSSPSSLIPIIGLV